MPGCAKPDKDSFRATMKAASVSFCALTDRLDGNLSKVRAALEPRALRQESAMDAIIEFFVMLLAGPLPIHGG